MITSDLIDEMVSRHN